MKFVMQCKKGRPSCTGWELLCFSQSCLHKRAFQNWRKQRQANIYKGPLARSPRTEQSRAEQWQGTANWNQRQKTHRPVSVHCQATPQIKSPLQHSANPKSIRSPDVSFQNFCTSHRTALLQRIEPGIKCTQIAQMAAQLYGCLGREQTGVLPLCCILNITSKAAHFPAALAAAAAAAAAPPPEDAAAAAAEAAAEPGAAQKSKI